MSSMPPHEMEELAALRAELAAARHALSAAEQKLAVAEDKLAHAYDRCAALQLQIERTREQLALMRRQKYGQKSERHQKEMDQLELVLDDLEETLAEASAERAAREREKGETPRPRRKAIRRPLPDHLPREVIELAPTIVCACGQCNPDGLVRIGEDVTEVLEKIIAPLKVLRYVRPRLACRSCETIFQAPAPDLPVEKGRASASLIASVIVAKYWDGLPLYRQSSILARDGVEIDRSTLADWIGHGAWWLEPLRDRIQAYVMSRDVLWTDDTPIKVLAPGRGKTKEARIWCYGHDPATWGSNEPPAMLYCYSADRKGERPRTHLERYAGWLHSDAYAGYEKIFGNKDGKPSPIRPGACMAHARRYFFDVYATQPAPLAEEAVARIGLLYDIEREIRGLPPDQRLAVRQARAVPILKDFHIWATAQKARVSSKYALGKAFNYALKRWDRLCAYTRDGRLSIDNNFSERCLRNIAVTRKNFLFLGSDRGGERAAIFYTLLTTAALNGLNPERWLADVLDRLARGHPMHQIDDLLPWNWSLQAKPQAT